MDAGGIARGLRGDFMTIEYRQPDITEVEGFAELYHNDSLCFGA